MTRDMFISSVEFGDRCSMQSEISKYGGNACSGKVMCKIWKTLTSPLGSEDRTLKDDVRTGKTLRRPPKGFSSDTFMSHPGNVVDDVLVERTANYAAL